MSFNLKSIAIAFAGLVIACSLAGCGMQGDSSSEAQAAPELGFSGPWAEQLTYAYSRSTSDFAQLALADGVISDQELAEAQSRLTGCLEGLGFSEISFLKGGGYSNMPPVHLRSEDVNSKATRESMELGRRCRAESGYDEVAGMYHDMRRNPENLNESAIIAACLVRSGVVERGYNAEAYKRDIANYSGPVNEASPAFGAWEQCNMDPIGAFRGQ